ncbi:hypothetical protein NDU88_003652 [Pleurodeles waltl]|uniref:Uncharacterized protein n=1 Tax=Pleurodeles waltl TaxID=8319 RepID=A0AAV7NM24_PLEWA|nr:hypothetical protein NDU88_003652 [Pleurodeles waltl]
MHFQKGRGGHNAPRVLSGGEGHAGTGWGGGGPRWPVLADWCYGRADRAWGSGCGEAAILQRIRLTELELERPLPVLADRPTRPAEGWLPLAPDGQKNEVRWPPAESLCWGPWRALKTPVGAPLLPYWEPMLCAGLGLGASAGRHKHTTRSKYRGDDRSADRRRPLPLHLSSMDHAIGAQTSQSPGDKAAKRERGPIGPCAENRGEPRRSAGTLGQTSETWHTPIFATGRSD